MPRTPQLWPLHRLGSPLSVDQHQVPSRHQFQRGSNQNRPLSNKDPLKTPERAALAIPVPTVAGEGERSAALSCAKLLPDSRGPPREKRPSSAGSLSMMNSIHGIRVQTHPFFRQQKLHAKRPPDSRPSTTPAAAPNTVEEKGGRAQTACDSLVIRPGQASSAGPGVQNLGSPLKVSSKKGAIDAVMQEIAKLQSGGSFQALMVAERDTGNMEQLEGKSRKSLAATEGRPHTTAGIVERIDGGRRTSRPLKHAQSRYIPISQVLWEMQKLSFKHLNTDQTWDWN